MKHVLIVVAMVAVGSIAEAAPITLVSDAGVFTQQVGVLNRSEFIGQPFAPVPTCPIDIKTTAPCVYESGGVTYTATQGVGTKQRPLIVYQGFGDFNGLESAMIPTDIGQFTLGFDPTLSVGFDLWSAGSTDQYRVAINDILGGTTIFDLNTTGGLVPTFAGFISLIQITGVSLWAVPDGNITNITIGNVLYTPEPTTWLLLALGLGLFATQRRPLRLSLG